MSLLYKLKNILKTDDHLSPVEKKINYLFHNREYLVQAFTHKSITPSPRRNYERLEFLGDTVIDLIVSRELMREFPEGDEGLLTQRRASLVRKSFLAQISKMLDLINHINIEASVNMSIEKIAEKQQANLFEAIIGAIYLDGGIEPCRNLILDTIWAHRTEAWKSTNYKGKLIEYCHLKEIGSPSFNVKDITGPDHQKTFEIEVKIDDRCFPTGMGLDKKSAEQTAAKIALETLNAPFYLDHDSSSLILSLIFAAFSNSSSSTACFNLTSRSSREYFGIMVCLLSDTISFLSTPASLITSSVTYI